MVLIWQVHWLYLSLAEYSFVILHIFRSVKYKLSVYLPLKIPGIALKSLCGGCMAAHTHYTYRYRHTHIPTYMYMYTYIH